MFKFDREAWINEIVSKSSAYIRAEYEELRDAQTAVHVDRCGNRLLILPGPDFVPRNAEVALVEAPDGQMWLAVIP